MVANTIAFSYTDQQNAGSHQFWAGFSAGTDKNFKEKFGGTLKLSGGLDAEISGGFYASWGYRLPVFGTDSSSNYVIDYSFDESGLAFGGNQTPFEGTAQELVGGDFSRNSGIFHFNAGFEFDFAFAFDLHTKIFGKNLGGFDIDIGEAVSIEFISVTPEKISLFDTVIGSAAYSDQGEPVSGPVDQPITLASQFSTNSAELSGQYTAGFSVPVIPEITLGLTYNFGKGFGYSLNLKNYLPETKQPETSEYELESHYTAPLTLASLTLKQSFSSAMAGTYADGKIFGARTLASVTPAVDLDNIVAAAIQAQTWNPAFSFDLTKSIDAKAIKGSFTLSTIDLDLSFPVSLEEEQTQTLVGSDVQLKFFEDTSEREVSLEVYENGQLIGSNLTEWTGSWETFQTLSFGGYDGALRIETSYSAKIEEKLSYNIVTEGSLTLDILKFSGKFQAKGLGPFGKISAFKFSADPLFSLKQQLFRDSANIGNTTREFQTGYVDGEDLFVLLGDFEQEYDSSYAGILAGGRALTGLSDDLKWELSNLSLADIADPRTILGNSAADLFFGSLPTLANHNLVNEPDHHLSIRSVVLLLEDLFASAVDADAFDTVSAPLLMDNFGVSFLEEEGTAHLKDYVLIEATSVDGKDAVAIKLKEGFPFAGTAPETFKLQYTGVDRAGNTATGTVELSTVDWNSFNSCKKEALNDIYFDGAVNPADIASVMQNFAGSLNVTGNDEFFNPTEDTVVAQTVASTAGIGVRVDQQGLVTFVHTDSEAVAFAEASLSSYGGLITNFHYDVIFFDACSEGNTRLDSDNLVSLRLMTPDAQDAMGLVVSAVGSENFEADFGAVRALAPGEEYTVNIAFPRTNSPQRMDLEFSLTMADGDLWNIAVIDDFDNFALLTGNSDEVGISRLAPTSIAEFLLGGSSEAIIWANSAEGGTEGLEDVVDVEIGRIPVRFDALEEAYWITPVAGETAWSGTTAQFDLVYVSRTQLLGPDEISFQLDTDAGLSHMAIGQTGVIDISLSDLDQHGSHQGSDYFVYRQRFEIDIEQFTGIAGLNETKSFSVTPIDRVIDHIPSVVQDIAVRPLGANSVSIEVGEGFVDIPTDRLKPIKPGEILTLDARFGSVEIVENGNREFIRYRLDDDAREMIVLSDGAFTDSLTLEYRGQSRIEQITFGLDVTDTNRFEPYRQEDLRLLIETDGVAKQFSLGDLLVHPQSWEVVSVTTTGGTIERQGTDGFKARATFADATAEFILGDDGLPELDRFGVPELKHRDDPETLTLVLAHESDPTIQRTVDFELVFVRPFSAPLDQSVIEGEELFIRYDELIVAAFPETPSGARFSVDLVDQNGGYVGEVYENSTSGAIVYSATDTLVLGEDQVGLASIALGETASDTVLVAVTAHTDGDPVVRYVQVNVEIAGRDTPTQTHDDILWVGSFLADSELIAPVFSNDQGEAQTFEDAQVVSSYPHISFANDSQDEPGLRIDRDPRPDKVYYDLNSFTYQVDGVTADVDVRKSSASKIGLYQSTDRLTLFDEPTADNPFQSEAVKFTLFSSLEENFDYVSLGDGETLALRVVFEFEDLDGNPNTSESPGFYLESLQTSDSLFLTSDEDETRQLSLYLTDEFSSADLHIFSLEDVSAELLGSHNINYRTEVVKLSVDEAGEIIHQIVQAEHVSGQIEVTLQPAPDEAIIDIDFASNAQEFWSVFDGDSGLERVFYVPGEGLRDIRISAENIAGAVTFSLNTDRPDLITFSQDLVTVSNDVDGLVSFHLTGDGTDREDIRIGFGISAADDPIAADRIGKSNFEYIIDIVSEDDFQAVGIGSPAGAAVTDADGTVYVGQAESGLYEVLGTAIPGTKVTLSFKDNNGSVVHSETVDVDDTGQYSVDISDTISDGEYRLEIDYAYTYRENGDESADDEIFRTSETIEKIVLDRSPPEQVKFIEAAIGVVNGRAALFVEGLIPMDDLGTVGVDITVDGGSVEFLRYEVSERGWFTGVVSLDTIPEGSVQYNARLFDWAGNFGDFYFSDTDTENVLEIDRTAPLIGDYETQSLKASYQDNVSIDVDAGVEGILIELVLNAPPLAAGEIQSDVRIGFSFGGEVRFSEWYGADETTLGLSAVLGGFDHDQYTYWVEDRHGNASAERTVFLDLPSSDDIAGSLARPTLDTFSDGPHRTGDMWSTEPTPYFSGTGVPGTVIMVVFDGVLLGEAAVDASGRWELSVTKPIEDNDWQSWTTHRDTYHDIELIARIGDLILPDSGRVFAHGSEITSQTVPMITDFSAEGSTVDGLTFDGKVTLSGTSDRVSLIEVRDQTGKVLATVYPSDIAPHTTSWSVELTGLKVGITDIDIVKIDIDGNEVSHGVPYRILNAAPYVDPSRLGDGINEIVTGSDIVMFGDPLSWLQARPIAGDNIVLRGALGYSQEDWTAGQTLVTGGDGEIAGDRAADGNDIILGSAYTQGGFKDELIFGDSYMGTTDLQFRHGDDIIFAAEGNDVVIGDVGYIGLLGIGGDDYIDGGSGDDLIMGDGLRTGSVDYGHDTIFGGDGDDELVGDGDGGDEGAAGTRFGNDTIVGGDGDDTLHGDDLDSLSENHGGDDYLEGGLGDDRYWAGGGDDTLVLGFDRDIARGQLGDDTYIVQAGGGRTSIYEQGGEDFVLIELNPVELTFAKDGADLVMELLGQDLIKLKNAFSVNTDEHFEDIGFVWDDSGVIKSEFHTFQEFEDQYLI